ncbi:MAG TPA: hypothetical protein VFS67_03530 [Polyangiaceae bacterium]|nr:hypothetical protein [Polyangiaceae bacterium]
MSQLTASTSATTEAAVALHHRSHRSRRALWIALWILALVLILPALRVGPVFDDWFHAFDIHDPQASAWQRWFGLYDFFHADQVAQGREYGVLPWWTDDRLSIAFFRPLSSLLLALDHRVLDGGGFWSHLHAALWFAGVVWAAARVQRLLFGERDARWATVLFALSSVHVLPLAFVASIYAHVTALFALLSFECLIRAQRDGAMRWRLWSALWFLIALAGGESALVLLPIAGAYLWAELGWRRALVWLTPHAVATALYLVVYFSLDMGTHHSAAYLQPGSLEFFRELLPRFLVLSAGLLAAFTPDLWLLGAQPVQVTVGVVALALSALALRAVLRGMHETARRRLVALCAGALVALLPVTAGIPGGRLLILPSVIACALFAMAGRRAVQGWRDRKRTALLLGAWVALCGIGLHPLFRVLVPLDMARVGKEIPAAAHALAERCKGRAVLGIGVPDPNAAYLSAILISMPDTQRPQALHLISMAPGRHHLRQTAPERYELTVDGAFLALPWARIYRDTPLAAPQALELRGVRVELLEAGEERTRLGLRVPGEACWVTLERGELVAVEAGRQVEWVPTGR